MFFKGKWRKFSPLTVYVLRIESKAIEKNKETGFLQLTKSKQNNLSLWMKRTLFVLIQNWNQRTKNLFQKLDTVKLDGLRQEVFHFGSDFVIVRPFNIQVIAHLWKATLNKILYQGFKHVKSFIWKQFKYQLHFIHFKNSKLCIFLGWWLCHLWLAKKTKIEFYSQRVSMFWKLTHPSTKQ